MGAILAMVDCRRMNEGTDDLSSQAHEQQIVTVKGEQISMFPDTQKIEYVT